MFPHIRSFGSDVLDVATRAVVALQAIVDGICALERSIIALSQDQTQFRPLQESVEGLAVTLRGVAEIQREHGPATDRLDALELSRVRWEAECEGLLLKADGKLKAAAAAESRERQLKKSWEKRDPFEENGDGLGPATDEHMRAVITGEVAPRELEVLPPQSKKARAQLAKWGR